MSLIELKNISFSYPDGTRALSSVDLTIEGGEKTALLGENGSGKSTLLLLLNGTLRPESGDCLFKGKKITYTGEEIKTLIRSVGIVFQDPDLQLFTPSVFQEVL